MISSKDSVEFSAILTSLRTSVLDASLLLMEMLKDEKAEIEIDEDDSKSIVALLMYDAMVRSEAKYSYLDDFDFKEAGKISLKHKDTERVKKNIEFMMEYLIYREEHPVDLTSC